jgi:hypothetical protein
VSKLTVYWPPTPDRPSRSQAKAAPGRPKHDVTHWRVNGHPAILQIWTDAEFRGLDPCERPDDAQQFSSGIWALLRMV